jgi:hypothetical protein
MQLKQVVVPYSRSWPFLQLLLSWNFREESRLIVPTSTFAFPNPSPILYTRAFTPWAGSATTELLLEGPAAYQCLFFLPFILSSSYICAVSRRRALDFNIPNGSTS